MSVVICLISSKCKSECRSIYVSNSIRIPHQHLDKCDKNEKWMLYYIMYYKYNLAFTKRYSKKEKEKETKEKR